MPYRTHLPTRTRDALAAALDGSAHVVCHSLYRGHVACLAEICRSRGIGYSIVAHGMLDPWTLGRRRWLKQAWLRCGGRQAIESAAHLLFTSTREMQKAMHTVPLARAAILRPAVVSFADRSPAGRRAARARLGIDAGTRVLAWIGRFDPMKRPLETLRAFARSRPARTMLAVAGFPAAFGEDAIRQETRAAGPMVRYLGPVTGPARAELFSAADGFVSFSHRENFGYSFAEALAHGLPCLVSSGHDLLGDMTDHSVGWIADSTDQWSGCFAAFDAAGDDALADIGRDNAAWVADHLSVAGMRRSIRNLFPATAAEAGLSA
jgi:glycosyltransferase involved in cell wall biosynthesis